MNILFFITPKVDVAYVYDHSTIRQVLESMEHHMYSSIPLINQSGKYIGTITEGDLLWGIKNITDLDLKSAEHHLITEIPRKADYVAVKADSDMVDLIQKAKNQNFVPVVDDQQNFIGIITRKSIIEYCYENLNEEDK
ncbi:MAG: CBS domain-containing protein [Hespellia sp.]|nr:CBS domain-containing protein [Hespellia sp.]